MSEEYAGRVRARLSRSGLELAETTYRDGQTVDPHVHDRPLLVLVVSGLMREHAGGRSVDCRPGTALYHPPGEPHAHRFGDQGSRCLVLEFGSAWSDRLRVDGDLMPQRPETALGETVTTTGRLLHREFRRGEAAHPAALDGLALTLLAAVVRREEPGPDGRPEFLDRVLEKVHADVASDVGLSSLAEVADVSAEHLARTFREHMDCTVGEYVRTLRVERARTALEEGDESLSRIALKLGFYDQPHFTRTFRAQVGCPPGEYRRRRGTG